MIGAFSLLVIGAFSLLVIGAFSLLVIGVPCDFGGSREPGLITVGLDGPV
ncbi:hypothetical protein [Salinigranum salinum]|nr:hypothetical protein [Salinigranum salinum]